MHLKDSEVIIFFDDGGTLNDNRIRGKQWQKLVGKYLSPLFGGDPKLWGAANAQIIKDFTIGSYYKGIPKLIYENRAKSYREFLEWFIEKWINGMFDFIGIKHPEKKRYKEIYYGTAQFVDLRIKAAFPGLIGTIKSLYRKGYTLCTSSGSESIELKFYLEGMGIKQYFKVLYGPDLINILKVDDTFYRAIFKDLGINPEHSIVIDDNPHYLKYAERVGATVIQACLTGDYSPQFPYFITHMKELPKLIINVIKDH